MKLSLFKLSIIFLLIASLVGVVPWSNFFKGASTVRASGDLTVIWGVPEGDPIFVISNSAPGDTEERTVTVSNGAGSSRPVGIKASKTSGSGSLENVLQVVISENGTDLYGGSSPTGPKTMSDFFSESSSLEFIALSNLGPGATTNYKIAVTFDPNAGNEYQNTSVVFDLNIGVGFDLPAACENLNLSPNPIFGTAGNDTIHATTKSDLIITFEGNDKVFGKSGNDCIIGGLGNDELRGETGDDVIIGGEGNDLVIGATGDDYIEGNSGNDEVRGETGKDILNGGEGNDTVTGGAGDDVISGGTGNDNINGEAGEDSVNGDEDNDTIKGGSGADNLTGGAGSDSANGESGKDTCDAESENSCEI
jgi:Ca2+-binding RTX toxin-like protein